ncbi:MAG: hypothetical protein FD123_3011 [Bacteroidetes bacterium]|nr:MAG: hypothetical protein FD123_3011 [Bacteroidota bacterium]
MNPVMRFIIFASVFDFILAAVFFFGGFLEEPVNLYAAVAMVWAGAGAAAVLLVRFTIFRGKHVPFTIEGLEDLLSDTELMKPKSWKHLSLHIDIMGNDRNTLVAVNAALKKFVTKANRRFYGAAMGGDPRRQWMITDSPSTAYGSADRSIVAMLMQFCSSDLAKIPGTSITRVKITGERNTFRVDTGSDMMS